MIDIHSHILPYVDDGAKDFDTAIEMLKMAKDASTSAVVLTPHTNLYENEKNLLFEMTSVFEAFKKKAREQGIDIELYLGGEVFANDDILELAEKKQLATLNGSRFMLIEFDFYTSSAYIMKIVRALSAMGYVPIVAHPERYECIKNSPSNAMEIMNNGGLLQINKGSLLDDFGAGASLCAFELLNHRLVQFVASDAHSLSFRNTDLEIAYDVVASEIGDDMAQRLFKLNPRAVLQNEKLKISKPLIF